MQSHLLGNENPKDNQFVNKYFLGIEYASTYWNGDVEISFCASVVLLV